MPGDLVGVAFIVTAALALATKGVATKLLYAEGLDLATILFLRMLLAMPVFWVFAALQLGLGNLVGSSRKGVIVAAAAGTFCYYLGGLADFGSLQLIGAGVQRLLLFSYPAFTVLLDAAVRRALPPPRQWLALTITYIGIFLVMGGFDPALLAANLLGAGLAIAAALTFAVYIVVGQTWSRIIGSIRYTLFAHTGAIIAMTIHFGAAGGADFTAISGNAWAVIAFMVIVATCVAWFALIEGVRRIGGPRAALISTIGPPSTLVLAYFLLDETMAPIQLAGAGVIAAGVLVLEARRPAKAGG